MRRGRKLAKKSGHGTSRASIHGKPTFIHHQQLVNVDLKDQHCLKKLWRHMLQYYTHNTWELCFETRCNTILTTAFERMTFNVLYTTQTVSSGQLLWLYRLKLSKQSMSNDTYKLLFDSECLRFDCNSQKLESYKFGRTDHELESDIKWQ